MAFLFGARDRNCDRKGNDGLSIIALDFWQSIILAEDYFIMKLVPPHKAGSELLDIICDAQKDLVLVSPYVRLDQWKQLSASLSDARKRGVKVDVYVRDEPQNAVSWEQLEALGFKPRRIENLHAKLYFNESAGFVTSLNMLGISNSNSIEIGYRTETPQELNELRDFVQKYLALKAVPAVSSNTSSDTRNTLTKNKAITQHPKKFIGALEDALKKVTGDWAAVNLKEQGLFEIQAINNKFYLDLGKGGLIGRRNLTCNAIISQWEAEQFPNRRRQCFPSPAFNYEIILGRAGNYTTLCATYQNRLSSTTHPDHLTPDEQTALLQDLVEFVLGVDRFKSRR